MSIIWFQAFLFPSFQFCLTAKIENSGLESLEKKFRYFWGFRVVNPAVKTDGFHRGSGDSLVQNSVEMVRFHKISTPGYYVKFEYFWKYFLLISYFPTYALLLRDCFFFQFIVWSRSKLVLVLFHCSLLLCISLT